MVRRSRAWWMGARLTDEVLLRWREGKVAFGEGGGVLLVGSREVLLKFGGHGELFELLEGGGFS